MSSKARQTAEAAVLGMGGNDDAGLRVHHVRALLAEMDALESANGRMHRQQIDVMRLSKRAQKVKPCE